MKTNLIRFKKKQKQLHPPKKKTKQKTPPKTKTKLNATLFSPPPKNKQTNKQTTNVEYICESYRLQVVYCVCRYLVVLCFIEFCLCCILKHPMGVFSSSFEVTHSFSLHGPRLPLADYQISGLLILHFGD